EALAAHQCRRAAFDLSDADLRALQVLQDRDRPLELLLDRADDLAALAVILVAAVAEVQAEDVGAGQEQLADALPVAAGRTQRGDDLRIAVSAHVGSPFDLLAAAGGACRNSAQITSIARKSLT